MAGILVYGYGNYNPMVTNCYNEGNFENSRSSAKIGGICCDGTDTSSGPIIENCYNKGEIRSTKSSNLGGILVQANGKVYLNKCVNYANIYGLEGPNYVGGIVGGYSPNIKQASELYNFGNIYITGTNDSYNSNIYVGGISAQGSAGQSYNVNDETYFKNLVNKGNITVLAPNNRVDVGGISTQVYGRIDQAYNEGDITVVSNRETAVGGIAVGYGAYINNFYN